MNEHITKNIVREHFNGDIDASKLCIEEDKSANPKIQESLQNASKQGSGHGKPDFIITHQDEEDFLIVIECKADTAKHESEKRDQPADYAVDGALLYANHLSKDFDVLAIAVSGQSKEDIKISHFLQKKNDKSFLIFGNELLPVGDYIGGYNQDGIKKQEKYEEILDYSQTLNNDLHKLKIKEDKRSLLLSGILIALNNEPFLKSYHLYKKHQLTSFLYQTISNELKEAGLEGEKFDILEQNYGFIKTHPSLKTPKLRQLIDDIDNRINSFARTYKFYDILGQFYIEFLRYSNNDKGLGIVLTPPHITEFFVDVARIRKEDVAYDNCVGTGGFLITAMKKMISDASGDTKRENSIKSSQLFGVEYQPEIYPLSVSNMFLHGDGKSNILKDDCFKSEIMETMKKRKPTVGLLNPPYKSDIEEFEFVLNNLDVLQNHGRCIAIVPMSCVLAQKGERLKLKERLLKKHTLKAVFSMPDELFFNSKVGVVTAILVIEAHVPHSDDCHTFFGWFKDDGFTKRKAKGRFDYDGRWKDIKGRWLEAYFATAPKAGLSVVKKITAHDEWCAEMYMDTDYTKLENKDFENTIHNYSSFLFSEKLCKAVSNSPVYNKEKDLFERKWAKFSIDDLFDITGTTTTKPLDIENMPRGEYPYVTTSATNNGIEGFYSESTESGGCLTMDSAVNGYCAYQAYDFLASDHVEKLTLKKAALNPYTAMFLVTIFEQERYRYNYGRKPSQTRLKESSIELPVDAKGRPDWKFMENYIKSLPYSSNLAAENQE